MVARLFANGCAGVAMIADRTPRVEVVECASSACTIQFERPVGVRGGVRRFCSPLCRNFSRLMAKAAAQPQFRPFTYAQPIHETGAPAAVQSAHGHESRQRSPTEPVTGATAHSAASNKQQPTNKHAQKQGRENL